MKYAKCYEPKEVTYITKFSKQAFISIWIKSKTEPC